MYKQIISTIDEMKKVLCTNALIWQKRYTIHEAVRDLVIPLSDGTSFDNNRTRYVGGFYPKIIDLPREIYGYTVTWRKKYIRNYGSTGGVEYDLIAMIKGYSKTFNVVYLE